MVAQAPPLKQLPGWTVTVHAPASGLSFIVAHAALCATQRAFRLHILVHASHLPVAEVYRSVATVHRARTQFTSHVTLQQKGETAAVHDTFCGYVLPSFG
jgi:hypothetical protein